MRKEGILRRDTYIYIASNVAFKIRKGTKVFVKDGVLTFNPIEGFEVRRIQRLYFVFYCGEAYPVLFPDGGKVPYPMSML